MTEATTAGKGGLGLQNADGDGWRDTRKRHGRLFRRQVGRRVKHQESHLCGRQRGGSGGRHGARPALGGRIAGWRESLVGEPLGVQGDEGGRKASKVTHKYSGVGDEEASHEASRVVENS